MHALTSSYSAKFKTLTACRISAIMDHGSWQSTERRVLFCWASHNNHAVDTEIEL